MQDLVKVVSDRLKYDNLSEQEKINYIKNKFGLIHGKGKSKKKGKKK
jgi:hypothetical protein